jgi:hypothetical protein
MIVFNLLAMPVANRISLRSRSRRGLKLARTSPVKPVAVPARRNAPFSHFIVVNKFRIGPPGPASRSLHMLGGEKLSLFSQYKGADQTAVLFRDPTKTLPIF